MKKVLILPSTTGQGDLSVAQVIANTLQYHFEVATVCFAQNSHSPLWREITGKRVLFSESSHPGYDKSCVSQLRSLSAEIHEQSPDLVVALNEGSLSLAAVLADRPVIQLTHFIDGPFNESGQRVLNSAVRLQALSHSIASPGLARFLQRNDKTQLLALLEQMQSLAPFPTMSRAIRKLKSFMPLGGSRRTSDLIKRYGRLLGKNYLSLLLPEALIFHSIFPVDDKSLQQLNDDRQSIGKSPVTLAYSLASPPPEIGLAHGGSGRKTVLLTFGGIDHPITAGLERLTRLLNIALQNFTPGQLQLLIVGRVTETKPKFFEDAFSQNPFLKQGGITLLGSVNHSEHLRLIAEADLVMAQPGYATLCEIHAAGKPSILFYGLATYYEQFSNFLSANDAGLVWNPDGKPWLQIGEYGKFCSKRSVPEHRLALQLQEAFEKLCDGTLRLPGNRPKAPTLPHFSEPLLRTARSLANISEESHNLKMAM